MDSSRSAPRTTSVMPISASSTTHASCNSARRPSATPESPRSRGPRWPAGRRSVHRETQPVHHPAPGTATNNFPASRWRGAHAPAPADSPAGRSRGRAVRRPPRAGRRPRRARPCGSRGRDRSRPSRAAGRRPRGKVARARFARPSAPASAGRTSACPPASPGRIPAGSGRDRGHRCAGATPRRRRGPVPARSRRSGRARGGGARWGTAPAGRDIWIQDYSPLIFANLR